MLRPQVWRSECCQLVPLESGVLMHFHRWALDAHGIWMQKKKEKKLNLHSIVVLIAYIFNYREDWPIKCKLEGNLNISIRAHFLSLDELFAISSEFVDIHVQIFRKSVGINSLKASVIVLRPAQICLWRLLRDAWRKSKICAENATLKLNQLIPQKGGRELPR